MVDADPAATPGSRPLLCRQQRRQRRTLLHNIRNRITTTGTTIRITTSGRTRMGRARHRRASTSTRAWHHRGGHRPEQHRVGLRVIITRRRRRRRERPTAAIACRTGTADCQRRRTATASLLKRADRHRITAPPWPTRIRPTRSASTCRGCPSRPTRYCTRSRGTQSPRPRTVPWVDGRGCQVSMTSGMRRWAAYRGTVAQGMVLRCPRSCLIRQASSQAVRPSSHRRSRGHSRTTAGPAFTLISVNSRRRQRRTRFAGSKTSVSGWKTSLRSRPSRGFSTRTMLIYSES